ncbi:hypothetical protein E3E14_09785 [Streptomyces sp. ICN441]|nr:hypothetical protein E3E14_09785 [Streptomyces sp. ICN441]
MGPYGGPAGALERPAPARPAPAPARPAHPCRPRPRVSPGGYGVRGGRGRPVPPRRCGPPPPCRRPP